MFRNAPRWTGLRLGYLLICIGRLLEQYILPPWPIAAGGYSEPQGFRPRSPTKFLSLTVGMSLLSLALFYCCAHAGCGFWRLGGSWYTRCYARVCLIELYIAPYSRYIGYALISFADQSRLTTVPSRNHCPKEWTRIPCSTNHASSTYPHFQYTHNWPCTYSGRPARSSRSSHLTKTQDSDGVIL